ncbi:MAG: YggS family pyridoxal phosphate-dependent enzyme [Gammaproteobacteria bacterium]
MTPAAGTISHNLEAVIERIHRAAAVAGRKPDEIRLIAVSKYMTPDLVRQAIAAGQRCFGENTVQDAQTKQQLLDDPATEWHFIGHLQSNKARFIPGNFAWLHTLDSLKLATRLSGCISVTTPALNVLLQINIADDPAKSGLSASRVYPFVDEFLRTELPGIRLRGLMTIGPSAASPEERRRDFSALRDLRDRCAARFGADHFQELSMGMSSDFEIAIAEGATMVRVGTAIFGARPVH